MIGFPKQELPAAGFSKDTSTAHFERDVLQASMAMPVIVQFWSKRSAVCKQLTPVLEKCAAEAKGLVSLVRADIDANPELVEALQIQSVPTVYAFYQGQPVEGFRGARPEIEIRAFVTALVTLSGGAAEPAAAGVIPVLSREQLKKLAEQAEGFFGEQRYTDAMERHSVILESDPENMDALAGIGWCLLQLGDVEGVREILSQTGAEHLKLPSMAGLAFILSLAEQAEGLEDKAALEQQLLKNPKDSAARYDLALRHFAVLELETGIEQLIELIRRDRQWEEQKARTLLLEVFAALGNAHPLTLTGRRKLSTVLFS